MKRWEFVLRMRELGYPEEAIREMVALRNRDAAAGIHRRWEWYLPKEHKDQRKVRGL